MARVAVLERDKCRPKDCGLPCIKYCPEVRNRVETIKLEEGTVTIFESLCSGCGICVKKCPFKAITVVNLPQELEAECSHRYGLNLFKLYRLPIPKEGTVTGLIGRNGTGKTTVLKILDGEIRPNLGRYEDTIGWDEIIRFYRGSPLQRYFKLLSEGALKVVSKPQYIDKIPTYFDDEVEVLLSRVNERGRLPELADNLELKQILKRKTSMLSGGELQRVAIAATACHQADVYIFDEPSSHLDVYQRIRVAREIRRLAEEGKTILLAEHDLAMLDYLSDQIHIFYGEAGTYGIVSHVHSVKNGINIYLDGFIPDENMRFRAQPVRFHIRPPRIDVKEGEELTWPQIKYSYNGFSLEVKPGSVARGAVVGVLGPNGIGKTTFIRLLAGYEKIKGDYSLTRQGFTVSYKPQYISAEYEGNVESLLKTVAGSRFNEESFKGDILYPFNLQDFLERDVNDLSGGELQRVAIATCIARDADIYLLDEPSAYLDIEERLAMAKVIRKRNEEKQSYCFVVEHDLIAQDFIADSLMIFNGEPGVEGIAEAPTSLRSGMNKFLSEIEVTFRRDAFTGRPRVNKLDSKADKLQKEVGEYYYIPIK